MSARHAVLIAQAKRISGGAGGLVPPDSIDSTGATNVSSGLQAWVDAQPNGSTFNFTGKTYRIDQQMNLVSRSNITMLGGTFQTDDPTGDGSLLSAPSVAARTRSHWKFDASTNIVVRNMTIRGPNIGGGYVAALEAQMGFDLRGCINVEIDACTITDIYGDWVYQSIQNVSGAWCDGVWVHHCTLARNGRQGFAIAAGRNSTIRFNNCQTMARAFCDFEPNGGGFGIDNVLIDQNTVGTHALTFIAAGGIGPADRITISNNTCVGSNLWMIVLGSGGSRANWVINNNTSDITYNSGGGYVMELEMMTNVTVTNNTQIVTGGGTPMALAYFNQCVGVVNQGNTVIGAAYSLLNNASRYVRNCGNRFAGGAAAFDQPEVCVTNFGLPTQYSGLTGWFDAYQATDADLAAVGTIADFSGNARHLTAVGSARPTFRTNVGGQDMRCYQFDGVDDFAQSAALLGGYITGNAYTAFVVFTPSTISTASANAYDNDAVIGDTVGVFGVHLSSSGPTAQVYNWDGNADHVDKTITAAHRVLIMMRHEGGNLYIAKDGAAESLVASGATGSADLTSAFLLLGKNYSGSGFFSGVINEVEIYNVALTAPQIADRNARLMTDWKVNYVYGAADTFTRTDGPIGISESGSKPWHQGNRTAWSVVSNKAKVTTADSLGGTNCAWIDCGISDGTASVDIDGALGGALLFRYQDDSNYNMLYASGDATGMHVWLYKTVGQNFIELHHLTGLSNSAGAHQLKVVMSGSTVQSYYDGVLILTDTLTNCQTAKNHGLFVFGTTVAVCTWDNFLVVP